MDTTSSNSRDPDTFWGHFTAGIFLSAFGSFFLGVIFIRLQRIVDNDNENVLQAFLELHVPEQNTKLLQKTSVTLVASTIFGLLYEGLGARFLNHDLHPEYTVFHYTTHLTCTVLYLFAGWTGLLESYWKVLPADSWRASVVFVLLGETLLWSDHAVNKFNPVDGRIHAYLALISVLTAICITLSLVDPSKENGPKNSPVLSFLLYMGGSLGILWQGLWFFVAAIHQTRPIASTQHVTAYFVSQGIGLGLLVQLGTIYTQWRRRQPAHMTMKPVAMGLQEYSQINIDEETELKQVNGIQ